MSLLLFSQVFFPPCLVEMTPALQPRECTVTKQPQQKYGFFLRIEQDTAGHVIRNVGNDSPAQRAGLRDGDRVLRVNGVFVDKEDHAQVQICFFCSSTACPHYPGPRLPCKGFFQFLWRGNAGAESPALSIIHYPSQVWNVFGVPP